MQVVYERCAAIDVHQKTAVTTVMITQPDGSLQKQTRSFATMTSDLLALDDWLRAQGITVVAMESTGVLWHPIFNILEEGRTIILVNAQHMKTVPGRKTDVKDSEWLAELLRHGLLKASFIPPKPIRELRDLTRYRKTLVQERRKAGQPAAKAAGRSQYQAGSGGHRCVGQKWTRYAPSRDRRRAGGRSAGSLSPRTTAHQAP